MVQAIRVFDQAELPVQGGRLALHDGKLRVSNSLRLGPTAAASNELTVGCAREKRLGVAHRELVHHDHGLSDLDLPLRHHFPESVEGVDGNMLVLEVDCGIGADSIQEAAFRRMWSILT